MAETRKIVITGAAGLVGQNLVLRLKAIAGTRIVAIDKNRHNLEILARLHPDVDARLADLAQPGDNLVLVLDETDEPHAALRLLQPYFHSVDRGLLVPMMRGLCHHGNG